jgi:hypothetical protein
MLSYCFARYNAAFVSVGASKSAQIQPESQAKATAAAVRRTSRRGPRTGWLGSIRLASLLMLAALIGSGCGQVGEYRVVTDHKVDREAVRAAIDWINEGAGCERFWLAGFGTRRDWRGFFPPRGVVTIQVNPSKTHRWLGDTTAGVARTPGLRDGRGRIFLDDRGRDRLGVIAHELGHIGGLGHRDDTFMAGGSHGFELRMDRDQREKLGGVCDGS